MPCRPAFAGGRAFVQSGAVFALVPVCVLSGSLDISMFVGYNLLSGSPPYGVGWL